MTIYDKTSLKTFFQTGDVPDGNDYANFIDSQVNIAETSAQSMAGPLITTEIITPRVSATNIIATGSLTVTGATISAGRVNVTGDIQAATGRVTASALTVSDSATIGSIITSDVSANTVYASAIRTLTVFQGTGIVSAAGTTQGTAASLTNVINRGKGVADGTTTGFRPPANSVGLVQYLYNEGPSANLWPPTGGTINGLAANAAFSLAASAMVTIVHLTASAMAAK